MSDPRELPIIDVTDTEVRADCGNCFSLCCVALPFTASADFAIDKDAGKPCPNLESDYRCGIHSQLRPRGFSGCTVFDCFGAGQKVSQVTFGGRDWRTHPHTSAQMFQVFAVMRQLHEVMSYLLESLDLPQAREVHPQLRRALDRTAAISRGDVAQLLGFDMTAHRGEVNPLLLRTSELVRGEVPGPKKSRRGADLIGARLPRANLAGVDLRGAYLIAADLRGADLRFCDLIGADLRDADLSGADLTGSVFLTQAQLNAAKGDASTVIGSRLTRPAHWYPIRLGCQGSPVEVVVPHQDGDFSMPATASKADRTRPSDLWPLVHAERAALAADLAGLTNAQWATPSLCTGLTVREVLAHLCAGAGLNTVRWMTGVIANRFDFDKQVAVQLARQLGATPADTLHRFEDLVISTTKPPLPVIAMLGEVIVHGEDIRRPLGITRDHPIDTVTRVAEYYRGSDMVVLAKGRIGGLQLTATDGPFTTGEGPLVSGPTAALVMAMTGRAAYCDDLEGDGVALLRERCEPE